MTKPPVDGQARVLLVDDDTLILKSLSVVLRREGYEVAARFFDRVRYLTSTAFWTTTEGMQDLEYVGNVPLSRWDPPPPEVLRHIGLE